MEFSEATKILRNRFGSHTAAAKYLGLTPEHYTSLRTGKAKLPPRTRDLIILKAQEASGEPAHSLAHEPELVRV